MCEFVVSQKKKETSNTYGQILSLSTIEKKMLF